MKKKRFSVEQIVAVVKQAELGVPVNQPNKGGKPSGEVGEGRARAVENIVQSHMLPTQSGNCMSQGMGGARQAVLQLLIPGKSRMRKRARTDLCGGAISDDRPNRDSNHCPLVVHVKRGFWETTILYRVELAEIACRGTSSLGASEKRTPGSVNKK
jgi:hypothetical protein